MLRRGNPKKVCLQRENNSPHRPIPSVPRGGERKLKALYNSKSASKEGISMNQAHTLQLKIRQLSRNRCVPHGKFLNKIKEYVLSIIL